MKTMSIVLALAWSSLAAACGSDSSSLPAPPSSSTGSPATTVPTPVGSTPIEPPPTTVDAPGVASPTAPQLKASCDSVVFSSVPPVLDEFPALDVDAQSAIDELVDGPTGVEAVGFGEDYRWSIASRTDEDLVLFGQGETSEAGLANARFAREGGEWVPRGWGGCRVEIQADGFGPARLAMESGESLSADSTELSFVINERDCASGQAPTDRDVIPVVTETEDTVSIVVLVERVKGGAECPRNPWHPITITLESPLGSRQVLDSHEFPPQPVGPVELAD